MGSKTEARRLRLGERRRDVERRLQALRDALDDEVGHAPRGRGATLLLLAACCGLALAQRGKARREGKLDRGGDPLADL